MGRLCLAVCTARLRQITVGQEGGLMPSTREKARTIHTADGGIILDVENGKMFSLNSSGSAIFQLLEQGLPEEQIVKELVKRFAIPADVAKRDVSDFCSSLANRNLLTTSPNRV